MRLKTFLATFLLFLIIQFSSLSVVSVYMIHNQMNMLKDKSTAEYQMMVTSISKDIAALIGRNAVSNYHEDINTLVTGYMKYYEKYNINITLSDKESSEHTDDSNELIQISFLSIKDKHYIHAKGRLAKPFENYQLDYYYDVTQNIAEMYHIQYILLIVGLIFSVITASTLYFILSGIFNPLDI